TLPAGPPAGEVGRQRAQIQPAPAWGATAAYPPRAVVKVEAVDVHADAHAGKLHPPGISAPAVMAMILPGDPPARCHRSPLPARGSASGRPLTRQARRLAGPPRQPDADGLLPSPWVRVCLCHRG